MKSVRLIVVLSGLFLATIFAHAQQLDGAFGVSTVVAPSASRASGDHAPQTVGGGVFTGFSGDFLFTKHFGIGAEMAARSKQNLYQGFQPFRPIFYDVNAVLAGMLGKKFGGEVMAGLGGESVRFYQPFFNCNFFGCSNFQSSNHFLGHLGGGLRYYIWGPVFLRPEAHFYFVRNNFEFSSANANRFGVSVGYTFSLNQ